MNKKDLIEEYGDQVLAVSPLSNTNSLVIHYIDNEKILVSITTHKPVAWYYVKHNGVSFVLSGLGYYRIDQFLRAVILI